MSATALQLQNTTAESFKSEIVQDIKEYFNGVLKIMATSDTETYLSRAEVGNLLNVSLPTIWSWTNKGVLVSYRIGNKIRYRKSEIILAMKQIKKN